MAPPKFVLDTNCFIDAARSDQANQAFEAFSLAAAPGLYLSSVVAAELRAGARSRSERAELEARVFLPYERRRRVVTPSAAAWKALGDTLAMLRLDDGLVVKTVPRSFIFDILIAYSCRESGAVLVSSNVRDLERIRRAFQFEFAAAYPEPAA